MKKILIILALVLLLPTLAQAQSQRNPCYYTAANPGPGNGCIPVSSANPLPVTSSGGGGGGAVFGPTAVGSAAANPPVLIGGTANATGTGTVQVAKVSAAGALTVDGSATTQPVNGAINVTPTDCSGTVTTGGTAQNAFTASITRHGFTIVNLDTTEPLWISFTGTAAANTIASYPISAATPTTFASAGSFTSPIGFGVSTALSVVAATTGHKWSCTTW